MKVIEIHRRMEDILVQQMGVVLRNKMLNPQFQRRVKNMSESEVQDFILKELAEMIQSDLQLKQNAQ